MYLISPSHHVLPPRISHHSSVLRQPAGFRGHKSHQNQDISGGNCFCENLKRSRVRKSSEVSIKEETLEERWEVLTGSRQFVQLVSHTSCDHEFWLFITLTTPWAWGPANTAAAGAGSYAHVPTSTINPGNIPQTSNVWRFLVLKLEIMRKSFVLCNLSKTWKPVHNEM